METAGDASDPDSTTDALLDMRPKTQDELEHHVEALRERLAHEQTRRHALERRLRQEMLVAGKGEQHVHEVLISLPVCPDLQFPSALPPVGDKEEPANLAALLPEATLWQSAESNLPLLRTCSLPPSLFVRISPPLRDNNSTVGTPVPAGFLRLDLVQMCLKRTSLLVLLMLLQSISSSILKRYEGLIREYTIIPLFLTMLVGAGGNAGNQSTVHSITGLLTGQFRQAPGPKLLPLCASSLVPRFLPTGSVLLRVAPNQHAGLRDSDFWPVLWKEVKVGLCSATFMTLIALGRVYLYYDPSLPEDCQGPKEVGLWMNPSTRYYYNHRAGKCEVFEWGGCGGNDNNFETLEQCLAMCSQSESIVPVYAVCLSLFLIVVTSVVLGTILPFLLGSLNLDREHAGPTIQWCVAAELICSWSSGTHHAAPCVCTLHPQFFPRPGPPDALDQ
eukprot:gene10667-1940_t